MLRALKWLCLNRPSGDAFVRHGAKETVVQLAVDGIVAKRKRGSGGNSYALGRKEYKAFGSSPPAPVSDLLRVEDVNFQGQLDGPFWFALSPPQVARELNKVVNLDLIDSSLARANAEVRKCEHRLEASRERLAEVQQVESRLRWTTAAWRDLEAVRDHQDRVNEGRRKLGEMKHCLRQFRKLEQSANAQTIPAEAFSEIDQMLDELEYERNSLANLKDGLAIFKRLEEEAWHSRKICSLAEKRLREAERGKVCPVCRSPMKSSPF